MRRLIYASLFLLVSGFLLQPSAQAADKIRIGFTCGRRALHFPFGAEKRVLKRGRI